MSSPDEKREVKRGRRKFRAEILKRMERVAMRRMRCFATNAQIKAAARVLADRYMYAVDHAPTKVVTGEGQATIAIPPRVSEQPCLASSSPQ